MLVALNIHYVEIRHAKRQIFFAQTCFEPKIFYPKKGVNYDKSNSRQNRVKGPKHPNSVKKMPKSNIKFQNVPKNATKNRQIVKFHTFLIKKRKRPKRPK